MEFANPQFFWFMLVLVPMIALYIWRHKRLVASMNVSSLNAFKDSGISWRGVLRHFLFVMRLAGVALLVVVIARPQSTDRWEVQKTEGIDIAIALDISGSMLAEDFKPNRVEAAKSIGMEFVASRPDDNIGLVVFSGESFTQCPLTIDHAVLLNLFSEIKTGLIDDGTAIGLGLATAVNRLRDSKAVSKVIILLTDGENNMGNISPLTAAEFAKEYGIRVYTIGIGKNGKAPYPFKTTFGGTVYQDIDVKIDEESLQQIAEMTDGKYFRATDNESLRNIYTEIDKLEKTELDVKTFSKPHEEFLPFLLVAFIILLLEQVLGRTLLKNTF
ncbi:MAG: VWA domain-containing protein [Bacteroidales bacterium]|nr:VWA domain-containing protein [Bacteroidales bacterium]